MIEHYFEQIEKNAIKQQRFAIFDQKREKDIIDARLKILDEVDIRKPDVQINKYTIYDVDQSGKVVGATQKPIVKEVEEKKDEGFEFNKQARLNSDFVFDNILPPLLIAWMQFSSALLTEVMNLFLLTGQTDILTVITGYIAVMVISEIDNTYL